jgi:hypothetical protein
VKLATQNAVFDETLKNEIAELEVFGWEEIQQNNMTNFRVN